MIHNSGNIDAINHANIEVLEYVSNIPEGDQIETIEVEFKKIKPQLLIITGKYVGDNNNYSFIVPYGEENITILCFHPGSTSGNLYIKMHLTYSGKKISFYTEFNNTQFNRITGNIKIVGIG